MEGRAHKEFLNKHKLVLLLEAANYISANMSNDFPLKHLSGSINNYNNFQKLRYHGLVHHVRVNGAQKRGHWLITRNGWIFLRGEVALPKWVVVRDNHIIERSSELVKIQQIYYGSVAIHTTFEYFDDFGSPVGIKPLSPLARQAALL